MHVIVKEVGEEKIAVEEEFDKKTTGMFYVILAALSIIVFAVFLIPLSMVTGEILITYDFGMTLFVSVCSVCIGLFVISTDRSSFPSTIQNIPVYDVWITGRHSKSTCVIKIVRSTEEFDRVRVCNAVRELTVVARKLTKDTEKIKSSLEEFVESCK